MVSLLKKINWTVLAIMAGLFLASYLAITKRGAGVEEGYLSTTIPVGVLYGSQGGMDRPSTQVIIDGGRIFKALEPATNFKNLKVSAKTKIWYSRLPKEPEKYLRRIEQTDTDGRVTAERTCRSYFMTAAAFAMVPPAFFLLIWILFKWFKPSPTAVFFVVLALPIAWLLWKLLNKLLNPPHVH